MTLEEVIFKFISDIRSLYEGNVSHTIFGMVRKIEVDEAVWRVMVNDVSRRLRPEYTQVTLDSRLKEMRIYGISVVPFEQVPEASPFGVCHGDAELLFKRAGVEPNSAPGLFSEVAASLANKMADLSALWGMSYKRVSLYSDYKHSLFEKILANKSNGTLK
jgi:hypothetical protein